MLLMVEHVVAAVASTASESRKTKKKKKSRLKHETVFLHNGDRNYVNTLPAAAIFRKLAKKRNFFFI